MGGFTPAECQMAPIVCLLLIFVVGAYSQGGPEEPEEQKYVAMMTSEMTLCGDEASQDFMDTSKMQTVMWNESMSYMDGVVEVKRPILDTYTAELKLVKQANGKSEIVMTHCINLCKEFLDPDSDLYFILKHLDIGGKCPFDAGDMKVDFFIVDLDACPINGSNVGCYEAILAVFDGACDDKDKVHLGCVTLGFCIEPAD